MVMAAAVGDSVQLPVVLLSARTTLWRTFKLALVAKRHPLWPPHPLAHVFTRKHADITVYAKQGTQRSIIRVDRVKEKGRTGKVSSRACCGARADITRLREITSI